MLVLKIPDVEFFDNATSEFKTIKGRTLKLEHSLLSISKWESRWQKPFLSSDKNYDETIDYIKCMTIDNDVDELIYKILDSKQIEVIKNYITSPMTATWFSNDKKTSTSQEVVTSELIYYWMVAMNIPFSCEKWHINRLFTLIKICGIKNEPAKKMKKSDVLRQNAALNAARRKKLNSKG